MTKDAYYFSHDSNAFTDPKIIRLRSEFGLEGYGFYWAMIELMRNESDYKINKSEIEFLSFHLQTDKSKINQMVIACKANGLFEEDVDGSIYSYSLLCRMEKSDIIRQKRSESGKLGGRPKANGKQTESKPKALKERKGKERKEKETKEEIKKVNQKSTRFTPPTPEAVLAYCLERNNGVDSAKWFNFYSAKGWLIGKNKMKNWKAAVRTWESEKSSKPNGGWIS